MDTAPPAAATVSGNLQRVGFLCLLPALVRPYGVDVLELLAAAGLPSTALDNPEATIPYSSMGLLMLPAEERSGCEHLGIQLGAQIRTKSLGLVGEFMRHAPTLGEALTDFVTNQHRNAHGNVAYLFREGECAIFRLRSL